MACTYVISCLQTRRKTSHPGGGRATPARPPTSTRNSPGMKSVNNDPVSETASLGFDEDDSDVDMVKCPSKDVVPVRQ